MARLLANETPVASIDFVAFAAEEIGKAGSSYYLQSALARGEIIRGVLILDIIGNAGGTAGRGTLRAFSASPDSSVSRQLARWVSSVAQVYTPNLQVRVEPRLDRPGRYSDHVPFSQLGIPAIRLIELVEDASRQHTPNDLPQYLDRNYLRQATKLALAAVINLAFGFELPAPP
jgi:Zn-dependent M28 family amino/carboxypeptidase